MAKLQDFAKVKNPISGASADLLNIGDWWKNIGGVAFIFAVFKLGQMLLEKIGSKTNFNASGVSVIGMPNKADSDIRPTKTIV